MGTISTTERTRNIAWEVASYRPDYSKQCVRIAEDLDLGGEDLSADVRRRRLNIGWLAFKAFSHSHAVIKQAKRHIAPRGRVSVLTRRTLAMTVFAGTSARPELADVLDNCCVGSELKFVHGLEFHHLNKRPRPGHAAALILHDAKGNPFAYQKAVGYPFAYVWHDGLMRTHAGLRFLPAGSIVRPIYNRDSRGQPPPHEKFAGSGLVGITGCVADEVEFMRFSLEVVPQKIRTAALLDASAPGAYEEYRHHVSESRAMDSAAFAVCMAELVKDTKNYSIA
jgi:hypothetical protein